MTERFGELCKQLVSQLNATVILTGSSAEYTMVEAIKRMAQCNVHNWAGAISLHELLALIEYADLVITVNTCTMHFASALHTPQIILFSGQVHPIEWAPLQGPHVLLRTPVGCVGCELPECPLPNHPCMDGITVRDVMNAVAQLLPMAGKRRRRRRANL